MSQIKNGAKPLSSKPSPAPLRDEDFFNNRVSIPEDVKADMEARGLIPRWLNAKDVAANNGYHKNQWLVYRRPKDMVANDDLSFGQDPDRVVRRGEMILGYKTIEEVKRHRDYLAKKAHGTKNRGSNSQQAQELRAEARNTFGNSKMIVEDESE